MQEWERSLGATAINMPYLLVTQDSEGTQEFDAADFNGISNRGVIAVG